MDAKPLDMLAQPLRMIAQSLCKVAQPLRMDTYAICMDTYSLRILAQPLRMLAHSLCKVAHRLRIHANALCKNTNSICIHAKVICEQILEFWNVYLGICIHYLDFGGILRGMERIFKNQILSKSSGFNHPAKSSFKIKANRYLPVGFGMF